MNSVDIHNIVSSVEQMLASKIKDQQELTNVLSSFNTILHNSGGIEAKEEQKEIKD